MAKSMKLDVMALLLVSSLLLAAVSNACGQDLESLMRIQPGRARAVTSTDPSFAGNADRIKYVTSGETKVLADITGPAVIRHIYFLMAWGLNPTSFPNYGCTYMSSDFEDLGTEYCLYRWHIADPVRFRESLRFEIEHTGWITADETASGKTEGHVEREDDIATVAIWVWIQCDCASGGVERESSYPCLAL